MVANNIQKSFTLPQSMNVANSNNNGSGGGGSMYFGQEEAAEEQAPPVAPPVYFDVDSYYDDLPDNSNTFNPTGWQTLDRLLGPLKTAAAVKLYTNFPKDYDVPVYENN